MEVDFPTSRELFREETGYDFPYSTDDEKTRDQIVEILKDDNVELMKVDKGDDDDDDDKISPKDGDAQSKCTSDGTGASDFLGWPSRRTSVASGVVNEKGEEGKNDEEYMRVSLTEMQHSPSHFDRATDINCDEDDAATAKSGTQIVEFPADRCPFRRKSIDSYQSMGTDQSGYQSSGYNARASNASRSRGESSSDDGETTNDGMTADSSIGMANPFNSNNSRDAMKELLSHSINSMGSNATGNTGGPSTAEAGVGRGRNSLAKRRRSKSTDGQPIHRRTSLDTINSNQSLRRSINKTSKPPRRKSKDSGKPRRPSLAESHDSFVNDLPLLGWDKESDSDCNSALMHGHAGAGRSSRSSAFSISSGAGGASSSANTYSQQQQFRPSSLKSSMPHMSSSVSVASMSSSLKASQIDGYGGSGGLCLDFRDRGSLPPNGDSQSNLRSSFLSMGNNNDNIDGSNRQDLMMMMMEEEYDPRKPWRKAPVTGDTVVMPTKQTNDAGVNNNGGMGRRASGITMRSSFTSDMSLGDSLLQEMQLQQQQRGSAASTAAAQEEKEEAVPAKRGLTAAEALAKMGGASTTPSQEENDDAAEEDNDDNAPLPTESVTTKPRRISEETNRTAVAIIQDSDDEATFRTSKMMSVTSSLGEDDDGSELTELRQAQEALFPIGEGPESLVSSEISFEYREPTIRLTASFTEVSSDNAVDEAYHYTRNKDLASSHRSGSSSRDLSSLDIVHEEQPHYDHNKPKNSPLAAVSENGSGNGEQQPKLEDPRKAMMLQNIINSDQLNAHTMDLSELDDLPTSAGMGIDSFRKSLRNCGNKDDDSVSYSDIDVEQGVPPPSIKMCMTVRDSIIEREFATEQMDVEFGETKPTDEMSLQMLLEGPVGNGNTYLNDSEHNPLNDSLRSDGRTSCSKKSSKRTSSTLGDGARRLKKGVTNQTSKLDTKATKRLRRKNKRLWKFCVWNCRKITVCLVLSLCILAGIATLAWWGATQVAGGDTSDNGKVEVAQAEPVTESGRIPSPPSLQGGPMQYPSLSPSLQDDASSLSNRRPLPANESYAPSSSPLLSSTMTPSSLSEQALSVPPTGITPQQMNISDTLSNYSYSNGSASYHPSTSPTTSYMPTIVNTSNYTNTTIPYSYTESEELTPSFTPSKTPSPSYINSSINETSPPSSSNENNTVSLIAPSFQPSSSTAPTVNTTSNITNDITLSNNTSSFGKTLLPSSSPSSNNTSYDEPLLVNSSLASNPSNNSSSFIESMIASSPSSTSNNAIFTSSVGNSSLSSTALNNNSSYTENASTPSSIITSNRPSLITLSDAESVYMTVQTIAGATEFEYAGSSVSMSPTGEFIAVGYKEANNGPVKKTGLVRVYQRNSEGTHFPLGVDSMFGAAPGDEFGASISISNNGQLVAVGARSSSSPDKENTGEVKIFEYSESSNSWTPLGKSIQGLEEKDRLGFSVSLSGDGQRVAVGAPRGNGGTGSASVHQYNGLDWILVGDIVTGNDVGDRTGFSVSLSNDGTTLAVGAFTSSIRSDLAYTGSVSVYKVEDASLVRRGQTLVGAVGGAQLGHSVSLAGDGLRFVVGSNGFGTATAANLGLCQVYELSEQNDWIQIGSLLGTNESEEVGLHVSLSLNGNVASCSKKTLVDGAVIGAVAILEEKGTQWGVVEPITSSYGNSTSFGKSVSLTQDGSMILVGAPTYNSFTGFFELLSSKIG